MFAALHDLTRLLAVYLYKIRCQMLALRHKRHRKTVSIRLDAVRVCW